MMKPFMKNVLYSIVIAAALALTSFSATAAVTNLSATLHGGLQFTATGGGFGRNSVTAGVWQANFESYNFWAFSIEPTVAFNGASNHYSSANFDASDSVKRLFEGYYGSVMASNLNNPAPKAKAFQLALWELNNDNGNLLSGNLRFNSVSNAVVGDANAMLTTALGSSVIHNTFHYTALNSAGAGIDSQRLLTVSPVPEPETYGMMGLGLGMVALLARHRKRA
jgi:hypothetical protein